MSGKAMVDTINSEPRNSILHVDFSCRPVKETATDVALANPDLARPFRCNERAIVRCESFRCLAIAKGSGKWVDLKGNALKDVREVLYRF